MNNLFDYYRQMEKENILLFFKGLISDKILAGIIEDIRKILITRCEKLSIIKKNCSVIIELAQNIYIHSADKTGKGIIFVRDCGNCYEITSGNLTENFKIHSLVKNISYINQMDKNELKQLYRKRLRLPKISENAGGNIGLLVIARKSEHPINPVVHLVSRDQSFIEFSVKINK